MIRQWYHLGSSLSLGRNRLFLPRNDGAPGESVRTKSEGAVPRKSDATAEVPDFRGPLRENSP
jgi:hypothetical protein